MYKFIPSLADQEKWEWCFEGGINFRRQFLRRAFRESQQRYIWRRDKMSATNVPAKAAILEIANQVASRLYDMRIKTDSLTIPTVWKGHEGGVDGLGSPIEAFIREQVLPELLVMGCAYVQGFGPTNVQTRWEAQGKHPRFSLIRRITQYEPDVRCVAKNAPSHESPFYNVELIDEKLPVVVFTIGRSIMEDIADAQIQYANIESVIDAAVMDASIPFYTEKTRPELALKVERNKELPAEVTDQGMGGRTYTDERPGFIEQPMSAVKEGRERLKEIEARIRASAQLAIANLGAASVEARREESRAADAGLSFIGMAIAAGVQEMATLYKYIAGETGRTSVTFPRTFYTLTPKERNEEAKNKVELASKVPSNTLRQEMMIDVARLVVGDKLPSDVLETIENEVRAAPVTVWDMKHVAEGILAPEDAARACGYPEDTVERATDYRVKKLAAIVEAQNAVQMEAEEPKPVVTDERRGEGT